MCTDKYVEALKNTIDEVVGKCWNCNFCYSSCPNYDSTRGFQTQGPSGITQALYYAVKWDRFDGEDARDLCRIVYACTTCNACVNTCNKMSAGVSLLDAVEAGRQLLVESMKGPMPRQARCLEKIDRHGNPYGKPAKKRLEWTDGRSVKRVPEQTVENLLYVGCSAAFNPELHSIATSLVDLLTLAGVDFGILEKEVCCGDPARTLGDHFLLEELVERNSALVGQCHPKTITTLSPHCYTTMLKHYHTLSQNSEILHYTQTLIPYLPVFGKKWKETKPVKVTYHDPCYLGKHNSIYDAPRKLITAIPTVELIEMRHSHEDSLCCGGGGGRMFEEMEETVRLGPTRVEEALETNADILLTACPWCHQMLAEAVKDRLVEDRLRVMDVAELLLENIR